MIPISYMLKNMLTNRTRLILTILAVTWGTFSIAVMLSVGEGLRLTFGSAINTTGSGVLYFSGQSSTRAYDGQANGFKVTFTEDDLARLTNAMRDRAKVTGDVEWSDAKLYYGKKARRGALIVAVGPNYLEIHGIRIAPGGRFINENDEKNKRQVIVLGSRTVERLFKPKENPDGKYVHIGSNPFLVVGHQERSMQLLETNSVPDNYSNWVPYTTYQALTTNRNYTNFIIAPFDLNDVPLLQQEAQQLIARSRQLNPNDPGILNFINLQTKKEKMNIFFYGIEIVLGIIGTLTLIVAGVGIANVMYISVKRATREIGIRMAFGAKTYDILLYYAGEALLTTLIGGFVGLFMAILLVHVIQKIPIHSKVFEFMGNPKPVLSLQVIVVVIMILGIIGFLAGIFPARRAAMINPAEALRHEK